MRLLLLAASLVTLAFGAEKQNWQELRQRIEQTLHVRQPLVHLEEKQYGQFSPASGVAAERVSYATDYGLRVPAIVYREAGPTISQHPALVIVNGHNGDKSSWYSVWAGILYARAGAVVLTYDPIGEFERNAERLSQTSQHDAYLPPDDMARRLSGLMITDVMQAVSYLAARKDVDPKRIAVAGYSMGSFVSSLACALDSRIHACVLAAGGDLDGPDGFWDRSDKMCQGIPYRSLQFLGERGPVLFALNARRGPTLIFNGSEDEVIDIPHHDQAWFQTLRQQTEAQLGSSKNLFEFAFEPGGGHRPYFLTKPVALWLENELKFPRWTRKQIAEMKETRIRDWAERNNIRKGTTLDSEHHEGGTLALGDNLPPVARDALRAIPDAVWRSERSDFVYETFVDRAQSAIRSGAP
jgi:dienelactone hydrolase